MFVSNFMRYLLESLAISIVALYVPKINLNIKEILMISITGAFTLMIIDLYAPQVGLFMRHSLGMSLGFKNIAGISGGGLIDKLRDLKNEVKEKVKMGKKKDDNIIGGAEYIDKAILTYKKIEKNLMDKLFSGGNINNKNIITNNNKNISNYINKLKTTI